MMPILLIEDNRADAELAMRALRTSGLANDLRHFPTCEEAQTWLGLYEDTAPLVLLDLAFPGSMDGLTFLRWLRAHTTFRSIPVIILTVDPDSRPDAYGLGVNGYIVKPVDATKLVDTIWRCGLRWKITST